MMNKKFARLSLTVLLVVIPAFAVGVSAASADTPGPASGDGVVPILVTGNPSCSSLGYSYGFKVNGSPNGTFPFDKSNGGELTGGAPSDPNNSVTSSNSTGKLFNWSATLGIDAVIVKGGDNADTFVYMPEDTADTQLHAPVGDNGQLRDISHIEFCYDYEVTVTKTANATFTRTYSWTIDKVGDQTDLTLSAGQSFVVNYDVTVDATPTDSDWAVNGTITIHNPHPSLAATITGVTDSVDGIAADVDCGVTFPYSLAGGATLNCSYSADLPDDTDLTNTATVTTSGAIGGGSGTAAVDFGDPTTVVDDCIDVTDDQYGDLGTVCADAAPYTFEYTLTVGPYDVCGEYTYVNVASFIANNSETTGSDDHTGNVTVPCLNGCTLTQGYWKTHSLRGPAPYDDAWLNIGQAGADTTFFLSGKTYYEVLWTAPAGNAYYNLAHQYIAAKLNILNGASTTPAVDSAITFAESFFSTKTPTSSLTKAQRNAVLAAASTLDQYNNGLIGPGHCSE